MCQALFAFDVIKPPDERNPTLHVASFAGPAEIEKQLLSDLYYSDWYTVEPNKSKADWLLDATFTGNGSTAVMTMRLSNKLGNEVAAFQMQGKASTATESVWLVHQVVDALILKRFNNPGFCATKVAMVKELSNRGGKVVKEIYLSEFDGKNPTRLSNNNRLSTEPAWGPNNRSMVYTLYNPSSTSLVYLDLDRGTQQPVTHFKGLNSGGALSPDGTKVAMTLSTDGTVDLYVYDLATKTTKRLTQNANTEASPCWSPDGRTICFVSDHASTKPTLYLIPASGGTPTRLLAIPAEAVSPDWSPLSNRITFSVRAGGNYAIAVADATPGSKTEVVTKMAGDWESPSWTADGRHVVCSRTVSGKKSLVIVDTFFGTAHPMQDYSGNDTLPACSGKY